MANCPSCRTDQGFWSDDDKQPWCQPCRDAQKHRYYCLNRPPGYAQIPELWYDYEAYMPGRQIPGERGWCLGWVDFARELDAETIWKWELLPADFAERAAYQVWREVQGR